MNDYTIAFFDYMQRGGDVLWGILVLTIILWWFVLERGWYFFSGFSADRELDCSSGLTGPRGVRGTRIMSETALSRSSNA